MSMYLSNPDVHPIGAEPGEFIEVPAIAAELGYLRAAPDRDASPTSSAARDAPDAAPGPLALIAKTAVTIGAVALAALRPTRSNGSAAPKPTVVLVHGAWADCASWNDVTDRLQAAGYDVRIPPNNLRGPRSDADYLAAYLGTITGPIVVVGHAYGGVIITNAATGNDQVQALVYVDAFIPAEGDTLADMTTGPSIFAQDPVNVFDFVPNPGAPIGVFDLFLKPTVYADVFANEKLSRRRIRVLAASQRPLSSTAFEEPSGTPAWESVPSWAVVGKVDRIIPLPDQLAMARRAGSIVVRIDAPHLSMLTDSRAVTDVIIRAARSHR